MGEIQININILYKSIFIDLKTAEIVANSAFIISTRQLLLIPNKFGHIKDDIDSGQGIKAVSWPNLYNCVVHYNSNGNPQLCRIRF